MREPPLYKLFHQLAREYMRSESEAATREMFSFIDQMERAGKKKDEHFIMIAEAYELLGYFEEAAQTLEQVHSRSKRVRERMERVAQQKEKWGTAMQVACPAPKLVESGADPQE